MIEFPSRILGEFGYVPRLREFSGFELPEFLQIRLHKFQGIYPDIERQLNPRASSLRFIYCHN